MPSRIVAWGMVVAWALAPGPADAALRHAFIVDQIGIAVTSPNGSPQPPEEIRAAILSAAERHHWNVKENTPEKIQLEHSERNGAIWVRIDVSYRAGSFDIRYVSSEGLDYREIEGGRSISRNYPKWVHNLVGAITTYARRISGVPATEPKAE